MRLLPLVTLVAFALGAGTAAAETDYVGHLAEFSMGIADVTFDHAASTDDTLAEVNDRAAGWGATLGDAAESSMSRMSGYASECFEGQLLKLEGELGAMTGLGAMDGLGGPTSGLAGACAGSLPMLQGMPDNVGPLMGELLGSLPSVTIG